MKTIIELLKNINDEFSNRKFIKARESLGYGHLVALYTEYTNKDYKINESEFLDLIKTSLDQDEIKVKITKIKKINLTNSEIKGGIWLDWDNSIEYKGEKDSVKCIKDIEKILSVETTISDQSVLSSEERIIISKESLRGVEECIDEMCVQIAPIDGIYDY
jgi:hypothetical protein